MLLLYSKRLMETFYIKDLNRANLEKIKKILKNGGVIGFPTETVYGLGALFSEEKAVKKILKLKKRDYQKAFTLHLGSLKQIEEVADLQGETRKRFYRLAEKFIPGPLTVILPAKIKTDLGTVGVRIPNHPLFLRLARFLKEPLIGTSANLAEEKPSILAQEVFEKFKGQIDLVIDGKKCLLKKASTVLSLVDEKKPKILREGFLKKAEIEKVL